MCARGGEMRQQFHFYLSELLTQKETWISTNTFVLWFRWVLMKIPSIKHQNMGKTNAQFYVAFSIAEVGHPIIDYKLD